MSAVEVKEEETTVGVEELEDNMSETVEEESGMPATTEPSDG